MSVDNGNEKMPESRFDTSAKIDQPSAAKKPSRLSSVVIFLVLAVLCLAMVGISALGVYAFYFTAKEIRATQSAETQRKTATLIAVQQTQTQNVAATSTAIAYAQDMVATQSLWPRVVFDTFSTNVNNWPIYDTHDDYGRVNISVSEGKYRWEIETTSSSKGLPMMVDAPFESASNFYLQVDINQILGPKDTNFGVAFRKKDDSNFYLFLADDTGGCRFLLWYQSMWAVVKDVCQPIKTSQFTGVSKITISANGSHYLFFINDQYVGDAYDQRLAVGNLSLWMEVLQPNQSSTVEFDNYDLRVTSK